MHVFRERCRMSVMEYVTSFRLSHALQLMAASDETILDIALDSGFGSLSRFYAVFQKTYGTPPARYRARLRNPRHND
jgi:transcriptional regulator GlxA family with amidase domain